MRFSFLSLAAITILAASATAHADTFQTFNLSGTLATGQNTGTVIGTVSIDTTTGMFSAENVTFNTSNGGTFLFNQANPSTGFYNGFTYATFANATSTVYFEINQPSLVNYQGGSLCTNAARCPGGNLSSLFETGFSGANLDFATGSLTPAVAATPEPSSIVLLGTGVLGVLGAARRRFLKL